jgi:ABC-2 type transport system permease protein
MIAIYKREVQSYFQSMIGYAFVAFLMLFTGVYFAAYNLMMGHPYFSMALSATMFVFLIAVPILTMRSFAEERKNKTDQLLLTAPVSVTDIVLGKYLAMVSVFAVPVLFSCAYPLVIYMQGNAYLTTDYAAILMYFAIGCVYIAIGMFLSSLTESQIIAAVSTFAVLLVLFLWNGILSFLPTEALYNFIAILAIVLIIAGLVYYMTRNWLIAGGIGVVGIAVSTVVFLVKKELFESLLINVLKKWDFTSMLNTIINSNLFNVTSFILCVSMVFLFVFLTVQTIQKRRWS